MRIESTATTISGESTGLKGLDGGSTGGRRGVNGRETQKKRSGRDKKSAPVIGGPVWAQAALLARFNQHPSFFSCP